MASLEFTARRTAFGLAVALAALSAPIAAVFAGSPDAAAVPGCSSDTEPSEASLNCAPAPVGGSGAIGETELTDVNEGVGSPASPVHGRR